MGALGALLSELFGKLILEYAEYEIRRKFDTAGNAISQIVAVFDDDGDGVTDREEVLCQFDVSIPDLSDDYCIVNKDNEIGLGLPLLEPVPSTEITSMLDGDMSVTGNNSGFYIDDDVYVPIPLDFDGDGSTDWGRVVDSDNNGVPDASPDAPFFPVGSDEYNQIISSSSGDKSIIIVSPDGTTCVYDENGNITDQDCDTAYKIWVSDNNIMSKSFDNYTVTEGLLFITFLVSMFSFFGNIFRRRRVM